MDKKKILNPLTGRMIDANGATAKSIKEKQKKVSVLEAVVKRKLTKKPEPPKPEPKPEPPKKFGWEDLDEGVKDVISGMVKKKKSRSSMNKQIRDFLYYTGLKNPYNKLTDDELYDVLYKSNDLKKYVETNYIKKVINEMPDTGGKVLKNKIKYEYLEKFKKDDIDGENKRFVEHYRNNSDNRWINVVLKSRGIGGNIAKYVFLDMDKNMFWRVNLIIDDTRGISLLPARGGDRDIQERLEDDGIVSRGGQRNWNELVHFVSEGLVKQDLVNGRLVYNWYRHKIKGNEKK